ncbi:MAG: protocatechuate 3,4-dioxygenase subunit alpha [Acidimicrobiales bacterium]
MSREPTPTQTVGPFFEIGFRWMHAPQVVEDTCACAITIEGRVTDGNGDGIPDAVVEIFGADQEGRFGNEAEKGWGGFGRCLSEDDGAYHFVTVKPGSVEKGSAPHLDVSVFCRGLLRRLVTRCYFSDETEANSADALLLEMDAQRAKTLVATKTGENTYSFDLHLQGDEETAFFAW